MGLFYPNRFVAVRRFGGPPVFVVGALVLCLSSSAPAAPSSTHSTVVSSGHPHDAFFAVAMEGGNGVAVGDAGAIATTLDGGNSWVSSTSALAGGALFGVTRKNGQCIAVGQFGLIYRSTDCAHWQAVPKVTEGRLLAVNINANGLAYAVGQFGTVLRSADWGATWQAVTVDWTTVSSGGIEPHLYDVVVGDDGTVTIAGEFETILRTHDGEGQWHVLHRGGRSLLGMVLLNDGTGFAVGQEGLILKTRDHGENWRQVSTGSNAILCDVAASSDGRVVVAGISNVLTSQDAGESWLSDQSPEVHANWYSGAAIGTDAKGTHVQIVAGGTGSIRRVEY